MTPIAYRIGEPANVLITQPQAPGALWPTAVLMPLREYVTTLGGQRAFNRYVQRGDVLFVDEARYDPEAQAPAAIARNDLGRPVLVVSPMLVQGLLRSQGTEDAARDLRTLFINRADADAAAVVAGVIEARLAAAGDQC